MPPVSYTEFHISADVALVSPHPTLMRPGDTQSFGIGHLDLDGFATVLFVLIVRTLSPSFPLGYYIQIGLRSRNYVNTTFYLVPSPPALSYNLELEFRNFAEIRALVNGQVPTPNFGYRSQILAGPCDYYPYLTHSNSQPQYNPPFNPIPGADGVVTFDNFKHEFI